MRSLSVVTVRCGWRKWDSSDPTVLSSGGVGRPEPAWSIQSFSSGILGRELRQLFRIDPTSGTGMMERNTHSCTDCKGYV